VRKSALRWVWFGEEGREREREREGMRKKVLQKEGGGCWKEEQQVMTISGVGGKLITVNGTHNILPSF